ncbi:MAG: TonB-dependent receptor plug domain-containing protein, partial [Oceanobacter sp.]
GQTVVDLSFLKAGFFIERPLGENQAMYFSVRQSLFQYYIENFLDDEEFEFTTVPEYYDYQGKYEYRISDTERVSVQINGARDKAGILFDEESDQVLQDPGLSGGLDFEQYFNSQGILWEKFYDNGLSQKIGFSQLEQKFRFGIGDTASINVKTNDYRLRGQFYYPINLDHELNFGVDYSHEQIGYKGFYSGPPCDEFDPDCRLVDGDETVEGEGKFPVRTINLNLADRWYALDNLSVTPGVLYSKDDYTDETFIEPKLKSQWDFASYWALNLGYGQYHTFPDNLGNFVEDFGNPDLKLPKATHWSAGLSHQFRDDLLIKLDTYYKKMDRLIVGKVDQSYYPELTDEEYSELPRYTNDAHGEAWGVELFVNKDLTDRWYGWTSVAWSRTKRKHDVTGEEFRYAYDQPIIINSVASYQANENWTIGLKWRYQSGQLITPLLYAEQDEDDPELYNPVYGDLNSERLPAYHKMDLRADRSFYFERWEMDLYFEILNLYGRKNVVDYEYKNADYSEKEPVTDLTTIVSLGIKATF